jgi:hypothetical protein
MREVKVGLARRQLDRPLESLDGSAQIAAALKRFGEVELRHVVVRKDLQRLAVPGNRRRPLLQLAVCARTVEAVRPVIGMDVDGAREIGNRLGGAVRSHEHLAEVIERFRIAGVGVNGLLKLLE